MYTLEYNRDVRRQRMEASLTIRCAYVQVLAKLVDRFAWSVDGCLVSTWQRQQVLKEEQRQQEKKEKEEVVVVSFAGGGAAAAAAAAAAAGDCVVSFFEAAS